MYLKLGWAGQTDFGVQNVDLWLQQYSFTNINLAVNKLLSKSHLDLLLGTKKQVTWKNEDISKAFAMRYSSKRCYAYLRETLKYLLPGIS